MKVRIQMKWSLDIPDQLELRGDKEENILSLLWIE